MNDNTRHIADIYNDPISELPGDKPGPVINLRWPANFHQLDS